tara:strand:- start:59 stop:325 length:267 start_codon:yes stop_codon:yes gene_type:complete
MISSKKSVANFDANLKYKDPSPFHFGLSHSKPSTLIAVGILNNLVKSPKGPLAELTTSTKSVFEKQAWIKEKKELNNCEKVLDLIEGV